MLFCVSRHRPTVAFDEVVVSLNCAFLSRPVLRSMWLHTLPCNVIAANGFDYWCAPVPTYLIGHWQNLLAVLTALHRFKCLFLSVSDVSGVPLQGQVEMRITPNMFCGCLGVESKTTALTDATDAWLYLFRDTSLSQFLCQLRVFQLVVDYDTMTRADEFRQIGVEGMIRKACHMQTVGGATGELDAQYF